ncbi:MAG: prepilin-type N-terminal cleavage/methylation domain-containing protein [Thiomonas sp.]|uniref:prepilin-type N-terminal cleavage/methylation domain-containing protein n=1 Tax=Thiomonas sp. TaxID=2047785 RepID=UPI002A371315|nr:prepilin-type N-terminal cleavage/methylation domain-containing protein [Thiomonas sp.]MDY0330448.1 prepilin-type N-terminal cleavage/methylation domain-containing protein [Thiomonas sp.]
MMRKTRRPQHGLTLLEMMIAMLLLSMLLMLLFGGLRLASSSWDRGSAFTDHVSQMQLVEDFMRREISQAVAYRLKQDPQDPKAVLLGYQGSAKRLRFVALMPQAAVKGGLYVLTFGLSQQENGRQALTLWREPVDADGLAHEQPSTDESSAYAPVILARHVAHLAFSYYGVPFGSNQPASWLADWPDNSNAPQLIRMNIVFDDGQTWPDLVVAPRVDMAAAASVR